MFRPAPRLKGRCRSRRCSDLKIVHFARVDVAMRSTVECDTCGLPLDIIDATADLDVLASPFLYLDALGRSLQSIPVDELPVLS